MPLVLPESVTVRLKEADGKALPLANVLLRIDTFATCKNDISLFPFVTNSDGVAHISKKEMEAEVSATYDSGLMDFSSIESAEREVEIRICTVAEVERAIDSRSKVWTSLLRGEEKRWSSISDMLTVLRSATNARCGDPKAKVRGIWDQPGAKFDYEIVIQKKS